MAVMIAALRAMHVAGTLRQADIDVVLTGDEEDNGMPIELARRDLVAAGKRVDAALDFEGLAQEGGPNGPRDIGLIARRSSGAWTVTVAARPGHSSGIFSPARAMARSTSWRGSSTRSAASCPKTS
jgi:glutamate carboxypeptidase